MENELLPLNAIKQDIIRPLFKDTSKIGQYGASDKRSKNMSDIAQLMETSPVTKLADKIKEIVAGLNQADPQKIAAKPSRWAVLLGKSTETIVLYQAARQSLEEIIKDATVVSEQVRAAVGAIDAMLAEHDNDIDELRLYIQAGKEYLQENPTEGVNDSSGIENITFESPRDRFARKLTNLDTLLSSHLFSVAQMQLARAQALDLLDRFQETVTVLVPVWRQTTLALVTSSKMSPESIAAATRAHEALLKSLAASAHQ